MTIGTVVIHVVGINSFKLKRTEVFFKEEKKKQNCPGHKVLQILWRFRFELDLGLDQDQNKSIDPN